MTAAAGGRSVFQIVGICLIAMTTGAVSVKGLSEGRNAIFLLQTMTFRAVALVAFNVCEPTGFIVRCVMAHAAAFIAQAFSVAFMGKNDRRPPQLAEDIFMRQNIFVLLGHGRLPPDQTRQNDTD